MSCDDHCWGHLVTPNAIHHLKRYVSTYFLDHCHDRSRITIGRGPANDLRVVDERRDRMISLQHVVILRVGASVLLVDTSLNGTYVNHKRVRRCVLHMNDVIRLGKTRRRGSQTNFVFIPGRSRKSSLKAITDKSPGFVESDLSSLKESVHCSHCSDYMVIPTGVSPCNDHFCNECIENHLRSTPECPSCSVPVELLQTHPNPKMTQIIDKVLSRVLRPDEYSDYLTRVNQRKSILLFRHNQLKLLMDRFKTVEKETKIGDPFLTIYQSWTQFEKMKFSKGILNYPIGDARKYYCWIVGLTPEWIVHYANQTELGVAFTNLEIPRPVEELPMDEMKQRLIRFIYSAA